jgi:hypothetical protein
MRGVMYEVPRHILDWRVKTGANRFDEMWNGVIHISLVPNRDHEQLAKNNTMRRKSPTLEIGWLAWPHKSAFGPPEAVALPSNWLVTLPATSSCPKASVLVKA